MLILAGSMFWVGGASHAQEGIVGYDPDITTLSREGEDFAFVALNERWPGDERVVIPVCWENPAAGSEENRAAVKAAAEETWAANSRIEFVGWGRCSYTQRGIRILIADRGPHTRGLGAALNERRDGMLLNFTFQDWGTLCGRNEEMRQNCIRAIAIHEFGHAIGFSHEHNRWDRPGECTAPSQGSDGTAILTPYDPESVMNYCFNMYSNGGSLSDMDVQGLHVFYGAPLPDLE